MLHLKIVKNRPSFDREGQRLKMTVTVLEMPLLSLPVETKWRQEFVWSFEVVHYSHRTARRV